MRADANKIAFRAIRNIIEGAKPFEIDVAGTKIACAVSPAAVQPWPEGGVQGLDEATDGPWPTAVDVECRWDGGHCALQVRAGYWRSSRRYRQQTGVRVRLRDRQQTVVWITVPPLIGDLEDGRTAKLQASVSTFKKKIDLDPDMGDRLNVALRELLGESGLPLVSASTAEVCEIDIPSGAVVSGADLAFRRLVQLALLKLEFVDRGSKAKERGRAVVDLMRWGIDLARIASSNENEDEEEDDRDAAAAGRRYWAGGFGEQARLAEFSAGKFWQIGWPRDATTSCRVGYTAPPSGGTCTDVDECGTGTPCGITATSCTNTLGSYICACAPGYGAPVFGGSHAVQQAWRARTRTAATSVRAALVTPPPRRAVHARTRTNARSAPTTAIATRRASARTPSAASLVSVRSG